MAGTESTSSSTSHTLTHAPGIMAISQAQDLSAMAALLDNLKPVNRHVFLQPPASVPSASLLFAKGVLDTFAGQVSDQQQQAFRDASRKRKRDGAVLERSEVLKIRKLHVDGFETGQIWQQAKRIITSALYQSKEALQELEENNEIETGLNGTNESLGGEVSELDSDEAEEDVSGGETSDDEDEDEEEEEDFESASDGEEVPGELEDLDQSDAEEGEGEDGDDGDFNQPEEEYAEDPNGLNDGFFSIDDFNKQTQWFEDQDARADPTTDAVDDEEEVNWHTDPLATSELKGKTDASKGSHSKNKKPAAEEEEEEEEEDEDAGPTFGDMALDAPEGASEDEMDPFGDDNGMDLDLTANDIFYKDFFAPPPRKAKKGFRPKPSQLPTRSAPDSADVERAMADVRRDLFDDLSEDEGSDGGLSVADAGDPKSRRSAHERRLAKLAAEIDKLERESVEKRKWTLSGEAAAGERPINSLLEEDLDFEHVGKPVPVITEEVSESIEALIKRRIVAREFDEVLKRRPDWDGSADTRRGLVELDDTKNKQSLAEIYEEEHVKKANPDSYVSTANAKLKADHQEIERMWRNVCASLDALSNFHYKPRPKEESLGIRSDIATVAMEDAQPTTAQGVNGGANMMAPQEIYAAGQAGPEKGEVVPKSGLPTAREEMSREEKLRRRRREKERIRKSGGGDGAGGKGQAPGSKEQEKDTLGELKKGGVKVINRKGEIVDVDGNKAKEGKASTSGSFKL